ncbi:NAD(P)H-dependent flavin oxidoreductase [Sphingomonas sp.]|jgi:nitronate monooxygenase|uniref:NAD(P)H-dependent flavin oxidoreductase n=1 Tax=Sphingomonas sp. TaxID=28214 RepID=UPI002E334935|nr:nitronate monooxygenase [Sphingomonas sp.]HEX4693280.1 nitronate monooxygenase [Sphingomonas sp.]
MSGWPDRRLLELTGAGVPIVQAPMAGASGVALAIAAMRGGAIGSLPCAMLTAEQAADQVAEIRAATDGPLNLNFFCHHLGPEPDDSAWRALLQRFYDAEHVTPVPPPPLRRPFDEAMAAMVEAVRPTIVSFHFGLPAPDLLARVRASGALVFANATALDEIHWLDNAGVDAIVLQGEEAGGHAGWFLDGHKPTPLADLLAVPVAIPTIAAGAIVDAADIAAALTAGASAVQIGTAYLASPESLASAPHRALLGSATETVFTNLLSGGLARGFRNRLIDAIGPINAAAPPYPYASAALAPLRAKAEADGRGDYSPLLAGTGAARVRPEPAEALTRRLAAETLILLETA